VFDPELVYDVVADMFKDDPMIKVNLKDREVEGYSRIAVIDLEFGQVKVGGSDYKEPLYNIIPDYTPGEIAIANMDRFLKGSYKPFDYIPVATPGIPENKLATKDNKTLEIEWINRGMGIYSPTPGQSAAIEKNFDEMPQPVHDIYLDRYQLASQEYLKDNPDRVVIQMEFNPFHPISIRHIISHQWNKGRTKVKGTYEYRNKVYRYTYDLRNRLYRLHSDMWLQYFDAVPLSDMDTLKMYDMVSNKDFVGKGIFDRELKNVVFEPLVVEPFHTTKVPKNYYSVIGPWEGEIYSGIGRPWSTYCPYVTGKIVFKDHYDRYCYKEYARKKNLVHKGIQYDVSDDCIRSNSIFIEKVNKVYHLYSECHHDDCKKFKYLVEMPGEYVGAPVREDVNGNKRSLIYGMKAVKIEMVLKDLAKNQFDRLLGYENWGDVSHMQGEVAVVRNYKSDPVDSFDDEVRVILPPVTRQGFNEDVPIEDFVVKRQEVTLTENEKLRRALSDQVEEEGFNSKMNNIIHVERMNNEIESIGNLMRRYNRKNVTKVSDSTSVQQDYG